MSSVYVIDGLRGQLFRAQKRWNESIEYFEKSIEHKLPKTESNVYMSAKYGLWEYAQVYVERNQEGDKQKAISLLNQALEIFQKMHAKKDIDKVKAQIIYLQTGRRVPLEPTAPVATGYAPLDKLLCGGIPPNFATVAYFTILRRTGLPH